MPSYATRKEVIICQGESDLPDLGFDRRIWVGNYDVGTVSQETESRL